MTTLAAGSEQHKAIAADKSPTPFTKGRRWMWNIFMRTAMTPGGMTKHESPPFVIPAEAGIQIFQDFLGPGCTGVKLGMPYKPTRS
jgi:hypothetical protein